MQARQGGLMMMLLFWVSLIGLGTWWFQGGMQAALNPNADLARLEGGGVVTLTRNRAGHFVAPGEINGQPVRLLLDTGATYVAIPASLADRLGLEKGRKALFSTANGQVEGHLSQLDEVRLGPIRLRNVKGAITPGLEGDTVLLGMSFLGALSIQMSEGQMELDARPSQSSL